ncbi:MAG TPA: hypothetical protein VLJ12_14735 [Burkholderiales bacterium]|nr:hypothetical protein [Burkholderiales bacterium]
MAYTGCAEWGFAMEQPKQEGVPFKQMKPRQKVFFILKLAVCILTFGLVFPNVMSD